MSKRKPTKREHIIPKFYLKGFSEDEKAWVVDFHLEKEPYRTTLNNILCISDFYNINTEDNIKDDTIEQIFSQVESDAKPIIDDIRNKMLLPQKQYKEKLATFLSSLYVRSPLQRQAQLETTESMIKRLFETNFLYKNTSKAGSFPDMDTARKFLSDSNIEACLPKETYIKMMLQLWSTINNVFNLMDWNIYIADPSKPQRFITGDFPFVIENKVNHKFERPEFLFANKYIKLYFPVSSLICLTLEYNFLVNSILS